MKIEAFKGFDKYLRCRKFQYEVENDYETDRAKLCDCGFHACEFPLDVFSYYAPGESRYCEVDLDATEERERDSKRCGKKIHIGVEIGLKGIIDAAIKFIFESSKPTTGYYAHATTTGYRAHAATTGDDAHAATTGNDAHAATTGDCAHAAVKGESSIACALGSNSAAKGALGCWLCLAEYDSDWNVIGGQFIQVDGEKIKADTYYTLKNGEFVEVEEE